MKHTKHFWRSGKRSSSDYGVRWQAQRDTALDKTHSVGAMKNTDKISWPHAPLHELSARGTYFVTAGTYLKEHYLSSAERLKVLHRGLLAVAEDFGWHLEAWAVFSNHYHFVGHSPDEGAQNLGDMLSVLHEKTSKWINRLDDSAGRKVWHNFWETRLTYEKSYLARLNYVHQNPVRHGLVPVANQYPWCSAGGLSEQRDQLK